MLKRFWNLDSYQSKREMLLACDNEFIIFLCEGIKTATSGKVAGVRKSLLIPYEKQIKVLISQHTSIKERRAILTSPVGINLLRDVVGLLIAYIEQ